MTTENHSDNPLPPRSDLAAIIGRTGDLGIRAIAAMANVSEDEVRGALARSRTEALASETVKASRDIALLDVLRLIGLDPNAPCPRISAVAAVAAGLLAEHWVRRDSIVHSTVTVQALTSDDIERLVRFVYWLTSSIGWLDVRSIINDSPEDAMTSPGAEALARELVAELLRKNNGDDHGRG